MKDILCLYHQDCIDGHAAAWVVGHACGFESVEFVPVGHGKDLPLMDGKEVYMVDFLPNSPGDIDKDVLKSMAKAKRLVMLDHHETAWANWKDVPLLEHWTYRYEPNMSGVGVAWRWFFGANKPMPLPLQMIQDRDLWKFELTLTREFHAVAVSQGRWLAWPDGGCAMVHCCLHWR
jgi:oligoribonuclease NrnB/cAMP/cGMP phosphodiesterase (DHH superfamily)